VEGLRHGGKAKNRHAEPYQIAEDETGRKRARPMGAFAHHLRDQRRDTGTRRCGGHKQRAGEQDKRGNIHDRHPQANRVEI
jgi:hypothetical protein